MCPTCCFEHLETQSFFLLRWCTGTAVCVRIWVCTCRIRAHTALINNSAQVGSLLDKHIAEHSFANSYIPARAMTIVPGL